TALGRRLCILRGERGLPRAGGTQEQRAGPARQSPTEQRIERRQSALDGFSRIRRGVLCGYEPWKNIDAPPENAAVVIAFAHFAAAHLEHLEAPPKRTVLCRFTFE